MAERRQPQGRRGNGLLLGAFGLLGWLALTRTGRDDGDEAAADHAADGDAWPDSGWPAPGVAVDDDIDPERVAAIVTAVLAHRAVLRREAAPVMRSYWPGSLLYASRWVGAGRVRQNTTWHRRAR